MKSRTSNQIIHLILNCAIFIFLIIYLYVLQSECYKYNRQAMVLAKYENGHDHKGHHYTEYYLTVKWQDQQKETETFEIGGTTYVQVKQKDIVYFKRAIEKYQWVKNPVGFLLLMFLLMVWIISAASAFFKRLTS